MLMGYRLKAAEHKVDLPAFLHQLSEWRLLQDGRVADIMLEYGLNADIQFITNTMLEKGWLTPYQVEQIKLGRIKELVLGQYRILDVVGAGGFGRVYRARHSIMNRVVALKVIAPEFVQDSDARAWFLREVLATTHLCHPNIVMAYDANEVDEILFLAMEYVAGATLNQEVDRRGPLPIGLACAILHQVGQALQYAHEHGIVHRDISPANLLLPAAGGVESVDTGATSKCSPCTQVLVKVTDFGLSRFHHPGTSKAQSIQMRTDYATAGTPHFMSPEQSSDIHHADIRSDLYSLGCTFYYALTGQVPFQGETITALRTKHARETPRAVESLRPDIVPALANIMDRLMAKRPEDRFQTPAELVRELSFLHGTRIWNGGPSCSRAPGSSGRFSAENNGRLIRAAAISASQSMCIPGGREQTTMDGTSEVHLPNQDMHATNAECDSSTALALQISDRIREDSSSLSHPDQTGAESIIDSSGNSAAELSGVCCSQPIRPEPILYSLWREWCSVIERCVRRDTSEISELSYELLHKKLLQAVRFHAANTMESRRALFLHLEAMIEPWLSRATLTGLDTKTIVNLLRSCQHLDQEMQMGDKPPQSWRLTSGLLLFFVIALSIAWWSQYLTGWRLSSLPTFHVAWNYVVSHPLMSVASIGGTGGLISIALFWRLFR
jgi:serine/threonine protein kinase